MKIYSVNEKPTRPKSENWQYISKTLEELLKLAEQKEKKYKKRDETPPRNYGNDKEYWWSNY